MVVAKNKMVIIKRALLCKIMVVIEKIFNPELNQFFSSFLLPKPNLISELTTSMSDGIVNVNLIW